MKNLFTILMISIILFGCNKDENNDNWRSNFYSPTLYRIEENDLWGYIDFDGNTIIEPQYDFARQFSYGLAAVETYNSNKWGYIDIDGELVIDYLYTYAGNFSEDGLVQVQRNSPFGYIDKTGNQTIGYNFTNAYTFHEGYAKVINNNLSGIINTNGKIVIPINHGRLTSFRDGRAFLTKEGIGWEMIDQNNRTLTDYSFGSHIVHYGSNSFYIFPYLSEGLAAIRKDGKSCYINKDGNIVLETEYDFVSAFNEGLALVGNNEKYGFINKSGEVVIDFIYEFYEYSSFYNGLACVKNQNDKVGFVDKNGNVIIPFDYRKCLPFYGELAEVIFKDRSWGYINKQNEIIWRSGANLSYKLEEIMKEFGDSPHNKFVIQNHK